jgi:hypothetical protein
MTIIRRLILTLAIALLALLLWRLWDLPTKAGQ